MRSTEVRAERTERMEQARRTLQSNQKYSVDLVSPRAVRGLGPTTSCACGRSAAAAAGDLLRHQLWPLAFCRAGGRHDDVLHRLAARGSLQFWRRDLRGRHFIKSRCTGRLTTERRGDTHDVRLTHPFAVSGLLTYSRSAGRPAGCVIMTRRHGKLLLTSARTTTWPMTPRRVGPRGHSVTLCCGGGGARLTSQQPRRDAAANTCSLLHDHAPREGTTGSHNHSAMSRALLAPAYINYLIVVVFVSLTDLACMHEPKNRFTIHVFVSPKVRQ